MNRSFIVTGLQNGDEGKGRVISELCYRYNIDFTVRYNGGAQAAHNIIHDYIHHTCSQFGEGILCGVKTFLSEYMIVSPHELLAEHMELHENTGQNYLDSLYISANCKIATPIHSIVNKILEDIRGANCLENGSCGYGIGEVVSDSIFGLPVLTIGQLKGNFEDTLRQIYRLKRDKINKIFSNKTSVSLHAFNDEATYLDRLIEDYKQFVNYIQIETSEKILKGKTVVFAGAQGVLLDETHGFGPHNTWSDTTPRNALKIAARNGLETRTIGVVRSYQTRHGAGPMPTENLWTNEQKEKFDIELHNSPNKYQGKFRTGPFDLPLFKYALKCAKHIDYLAVTHADKVDSKESMPFCAIYKDDSFLNPQVRGRTLTRQLFKAKPVVNNISSGNFWKTLKSLANVSILTASPQAGKNSVCSV